MSKFVVIYCGDTYIVEAEDIEFAMYEFSNIRLIQSITKLPEET